MLQCTAGFLSGAAARAITGQETGATMYRRIPIRRRGKGNHRLGNRCYNVPPDSYPAPRQGQSPVRKPVLQCTAGFLSGAAARAITGWETGATMYRRILIRRRGKGDHRLGNRCYNVPPDSYPAPRQGQSPVRKPVLHACYMPYKAALHNWNGLLKKPVTSGCNRRIICMI